MPRLIDPEKMGTRLEDGWYLQTVSNNCIFKLKHKWNELGNVAYVGGGRTKVSTTKQDNQLLDHLRHHSFDIALAARHHIDFSGSAQTERRRIKGSG